MQWIVAFVAGFVSTWVFHQGLIGTLYLAGVVSLPPFSWESVPPLGVPAVVSLAFWGGVWAFPVWWLVRRFQGVGYWLWGVVSGAVGPTVVALVVVFPLKGREVTLEMVPAGLLVNAAWGAGLMLMMYPWSRFSVNAPSVQDESHHGS